MAIAVGALSVVSTVDLSASHASPGHRAENVRAAVVEPRDDITGDGHADSVVGAPWEDLGEDVNAGLFHVLEGSASGVDSSGSVAIHQDTSGVPGSAEDGDVFGFTNTSGDFNGDGYADVAVSAPGEDIGAVSDGGGVWFFYGSSEGLRTDTVSVLDIEDAPIPAASGALFGEVLASGDFDGDGRDDVAIGAPRAGAGHVVIWYGGDPGATPRLDRFAQDVADVPGEAEDRDAFGWSLSTGDVDNDGKDELAVSAVFDHPGGVPIGSVTVLYGGVDGLTGAGAQLFTKDTAGVPGESGSFSEPEDQSDKFGFQVVLADVNGDAADDLAVSANCAPVTADGIRKPDAGTVTLLYSDGTAIGTAGAVEVSQQTSGMPGTAGRYDYLGSSLAAGDANGDGRAELAIYSQGDTYVTVVPGAATGAAFGDAVGWTQDSPGIPGSTEEGDYWGGSLRFADVEGTGNQALLVGAHGENDFAGAFTAIYGSSTGLTGDGAAYFSQSSSGVPGAAEPGDGFGAFW